jgi:hypothetical protein
MNIIMSLGWGDTWQEEGDSLWGELMSQAATLKVFNPHGTHDDGS